MIIGRVTTQQSDSGYSGFYERLYCVSRCRVFGHETDAAREGKIDLSQATIMTPRIPTYR